MLPLIPRLSLTMQATFIWACVARNNLQSPAKAITHPRQTGPACKDSLPHTALSISWKSWHAILEGDGERERETCSKTAAGIVGWQLSSCGFVFSHGSRYSVCSKSRCRAILKGFKAKKDKDEFNFYHLCTCSVLQLKTRFHLHEFVPVIIFFLGKPSITSMKMFLQPLGNLSSSNCVRCLFNKRLLVHSFSNREWVFGQPPSVSPCFHPLTSTN